MIKLTGKLLFACNTITELNSRVEELENALEKLLDATDEIYCNSNDLGLAEGNARKALEERLK